MSFKSHLPSKKIQALVIIIVALFATYFLYTLNVKSLFASWFASSKTHYAALDVATSTDSNNDLSNVDTDKDGLKDWQEVLWGTDKNNPDTDGDGTPDGEEVAEGRDPLIPGPNDQLTKTRGIASSSIAVFADSVSSDPNNLSTSLTKDFFSKFMALQTNGGLNDQTQAELIAQSISDINTGSLPPQYTTADIRTIDTTSVNLKAYGNQMAQQLSDFQTSIDGQVNNDQALAAYKSFIESVKVIPVPTVLAFNQLQILNNLNASYLTLSYVVSYKNDPLKALSALKTLDANNASSVNLFTNIASSMQKNDIIFNQNDPGSIWKNYY